MSDSSTLPRVFPVVRDGRWAGFRGSFSLPWHRTTSPYFPRVGFQWPDGSPVDGAAVAHVLPNLLLDHALAAIAPRPVAWRVVAQSAGFLGLGQRPIAWEMVDEYAVERLLLPGFFDDVLALAKDDAALLLAPRRGRLSVTVERDAALQARFAEAAHVFDKAGDDAVAPAAFWVGRGVKGVGIRTAPFAPHLKRLANERHGHDGMEPNLAAATLLRLLVSKGIDPEEARLTWPKGPLAEPQAKSYLEYFERGLDGHGFRDPAYEEDIILPLASRLVTVGARRVAPADRQDGATSRTLVLLPFLRPAEWSTRVEVYSRPIVAGMPHPGLPRVGVAWHDETTIRYASAEAIAAEHRQRFPDRAEHGEADRLAMLEVAATHNLSQIPGRWETRTMPNVGSVLVFAGDLAPERLIDPAAMFQAHAKLASSILLAAIPREHMLVVIPATLPASAQSAFVQWARATTQDASAPSKSLSPLTFLVTDGFVSGLAASSGEPTAAAASSASRAEPFAALSTSPTKTPPAAAVIELPFPVLHPLAVEHVAGLLGLSVEELDEVRFGSACLAESSLAQARAGWAPEAEYLRTGHRRSFLFGSDAILEALRAHGFDAEHLVLRSIHVPRSEAWWHGLRYLFARVSDRVAHFQRVSEPRPVLLFSEIERVIEALFANGRAGRLFTCRTDPSEASTLHEMSSEARKALRAEQPDHDACTSLLDALRYLEPELDVKKHLIENTPVRPSRLGMYLLSHPIVPAIGLRLVDEAPWPETLTAACDMVIDGMSADDRAHVAAMSREELIRLHPTWGLSIRNRMGLWHGNTALIAATSAMDPDDCSARIIQATWARLRYLAHSQAQAAASTHGGPEAIRRGPWELYRYVYGPGLACLVTFDVDAAAEAQHVGHPHGRRVVLFSPEERIQADGLPVPDEHKRLAGLEDALIAELAARRVDCRKVGHMIYGGMRDVVFQCADPKAFDAAYATFADAPRNRTELKEYPGWSFFDDKVRPGPEQEEWISNAQVVRQLMQAGSDPHAQHAVEHRFVGSSAAFEPLLAAFAELGLGDPRRTERGLLLVKSMPLDVDALTRATRLLRALSAMHGVTYDGWGAAVQRRP